VRKFINDPMQVVDEMLEGFVFANARYVRRAAGHRRALVTPRRTNPWQSGHRHGRLVVTKQV
jgi:dihydroxyacetone kinase